MSNRHADSANTEPLGPDPSDTWTAGPATLSELLELVRAIRWPGGRLRCPHCEEARAIQRWGSFSGRRRYRCTSCLRTFSDLSGTALAHTKRPLLGLPYVQCMNRGLTVRATANRLGIHRDTAFRWRHRILSHLKPLDHLGLRPLDPAEPPPPTVKEGPPKAERGSPRTEEGSPKAEGGSLRTERGSRKGEAGSPVPSMATLPIPVPYSRKGQRVDRIYGLPPRTHSIPHGHRHRHPKVTVLLLDRRPGADPPPSSSADPPSRSRISSPVARVVIWPRRRGVSVRRVAEVAHRLVGGAMRILAPLPVAAHLRSIVSELYPGRGRARGSASPGAPEIHRMPDRVRESMVSYWHRFRFWAVRFRGVASRYLENYLRWFRHLSGEATNSYR